MAGGDQEWQKVVYSYAPQLTSSEWVALLKGDRNDVDAPRLVKTSSNEWREKISVRGAGKLVFEARSHVNPYLG
jgi:hypothetical protein